MSTRIWDAGETSLYTQAPDNARNEEIWDIPAFCWYPRPVDFSLHIDLPISYKQLELILRIWDTLKCDFYVVPEVSDMNVACSEAPHHPSIGYE